MTLRFEDIPQVRRDRAYTALELMDKDLSWEEISSTMRLAPETISRSVRFFRMLDPEAHERVIEYRQRHSKPPRKPGAATGYKRSAVIEDMLWLMSFDRPWSEICQRLGKHPDLLHRYTKWMRTTMPDDYAKVAAYQDRQMEISQALKVRHG